MCFVSLHADPAYEYPFFLGFATERGAGAGEGTTHNFPLPARHRVGHVRARARRRAAGDRTSFGADALIVSLGVDTAAEDPDTFRLVADDFTRIGAAIGALDLPTAPRARRRLRPRRDRPQRRERAARRRGRVIRPRYCRTRRKRWRVPPSGPGSSCSAAEKPNDSYR